MLCLCVLCYGVFYSGEVPFPADMFSSLDYTINALDRMSRGGHMTNGMPTNGTGSVARNNCNYPRMYLATQHF